MRRSIGLGLTPLQSAVLVVGSTKDSCSQNNNFSRHSALRLLLQHEEASCPHVGVFVRSLKGVEVFALLTLESASARASAVSIVGCHELYMSQDQAKARA